MGKIREKVRLGWSAWGCIIPLREKMNQKIYTSGLRRPPIDNLPHNNQLKTGVNIEEDYG